MFSLPFLFSDKNFCGSGSRLYPNSIRSVDPYPDPDPTGQKWPTKNLEISCFEVPVLDVLFWGLKAPSVAWTSFMEDYGSVFTLKCWIRIRIKWIPTHPKHWLQTVRYFLCAKSPLFRGKNKKILPESGRKRCNSGHLDECRSCGSCWKSFSISAAGTYA